MKKLKQFSGGRGYVVDDVQVLQEQLDKIKAIYGDLGAFVISGCNVSGNAISAGLVCINSKMIYYPGAQNVSFPCYLKEGTQVGSGNQYYDILDDFIDAEITDTVELVNVQPLSGQFVAIASNNTKRTYFSVISEYLLTTEPDFVGPDYFQYRKDSAGFVHIYAGFYRTGNDEQLTFLLPVGFRPSTDKTFSVTAIAFLEGNINSYKPTRLTISISSLGVVAASDEFNGLFFGARANIQFKAAI